MIVVDEYLAVRSLLGVLPPDLPDEALALPVSAHWRLLQRIHAPGTDQLSQVLALLPESDREVLRAPHPGVIEVLDPRPHLDEAAQISAQYRGTGWLIAETITAALHHGRELWYGNQRNIGIRTREIAQDLGITIHVVG